MTADDIESISGEPVDLEELEERAEIPIEEVAQAIKIPLNPRFGPVHGVGRVNMLM